MKHCLSSIFLAPNFTEKISKLSRQRTYLAHCAVGGRSAKACKQMAQLRFLNVVNLEGGYKAWIKAGHHGVR